jgi:uncharacterized protein
MMFEWDKAKNRANIEKHGIDFEDACRIFHYSVLEKIDHRRDYGETRIRVLGMMDCEIVHLVYVLRNGNYRIISARKARKDERRKYRDTFAF